MADQKKEEEEKLARIYREGAEGDAWHELQGKGGYDPTLVPTPEDPHKPMADGTKYDPVDSEDHSVPPSDKGPHHDKLLRGLEPGETSME